MRYRFTKVLATLLALSLLTVAACGDDDDDGGSAATSSTGQAGPTKIRVTSLGLCEEMYMYWGIKKGTFAEHDLDVELVRSGGGAAAVAAIISGAADFAFSNPMTAMLSFSQGFPIRVASAGYETPKPPAPESTAVAVRPDSGINGPADLVGKKVAVNEIGGINQIMLSAWVRKAGGNPQDVNFVALPFAELAASVADGRVDAAQVTPGIMKQLEQQGRGRSIGDAFRGVANGEILYTMYLVTEDYLEENEGAAGDFHAALADIDAALAEPANADEKFAIAAENCPTPANVQASLPQQEFTADVDMDILDNMAQLMVQEKVIQEKPDLETLVPAFARA